MLCKECEKREAYLDGICKPCLDSMRDEHELASAEFRAALDEIHQQHKRDSKALAQRYLDTSPAESEPGEVGDDAAGDTYLSEARHE